MTTEQETTTDSEAEAEEFDAGPLGQSAWADEWDLEAVFRMKYGDIERGDSLGWGPRMRQRFGYYNPDDHYEALLHHLVEPDTEWLDVGCGRNLFPSNPALSRMLADRCKLLFGVDPDPTILENEYVHDHAQCRIDMYEPAQTFDLVTMRMVAEHVANPPGVLSVLSRCTRPGGLCVIYTVNRFSPVPLATKLLPFRLHQPIKRLLWRTESKDTFPTRFRMNTRRRLRKLFARWGFDEARFEHVDDCRTLGRFRFGLYCELSLRRMLHAVGFGYPENCLLGVYRRR